MPHNIGLQRTSACGLAAEAGSFAARKFGGLKVGVPALVLAVAQVGLLPRVAHAQEKYRAVRLVGETGLILTMAGGREVAAPLLKGQVGFSKPRISDDRSTVGWLGLYPNCCTSYSIPLALVIYRGGRVYRVFNVNSHAYKLDQLPIWKWSFWRNDTAVAFEQETVHGGIGQHYEIRDIASRRILERVDGEPTPESPGWIHDLESLHDR